MLDDKLLKLSGVKDVISDSPKLVYLNWSFAVKEVFKLKLLKLPSKISLSEVAKTSGTNKNFSSSALESESI